MHINKQQALFRWIQKVNCYRRGWWIYNQEKNVGNWVLTIANAGFFYLIITDLMRSTIIIINQLTILID